MRIVQVFRPLAFCACALVLLHARGVAQNTAPKAPPTNLIVARPLSLNGDTGGARKAPVAGVVSVVPGAVLRIPFAAQLAASRDTVKPRVLRLPSLAPEKLDSIQPRRPAAERRIRPK